MVAPAHVPHTSCLPPCVPLGTLISLARLPGLVIAARAELGRLIKVLLVICHGALGQLEFAEMRAL
jgi:hypothetical protein